MRGTLVQIVAFRAPVAHALPFAVRAAQQHAVLDAVGIVGPCQALALGERAANGRLRVDDQARDALEGIPIRLLGIEGIAVIGIGRVGQEFSEGLPERRRALAVQVRVIREVLGLRCKQLRRCEVEVVERDLILG